MTSPARPSRKPNDTVVEASGTAADDSGPKAMYAGVLRPVSTTLPVPKAPGVVPTANSVILLPLEFAANRLPRASKARPSGVLTPESEVAVVLYVPDPVVARREMLLPS